nr:MAG TPA_asm: hypothetical protein [Caudoviricetes sp.]
MLSGGWWCCEKSRLPSSPCNIMTTLITKKHLC